MERHPVPTIESQAFVSEIICTYRAFPPSDWGLETGGILGLETRMGIGIPSLPTATEGLLGTGE